MPQAERLTAGNAVDRHVLAAAVALLALAVVGAAIAVWLILGLRDQTTRLTGREVAYVDALRDIELISKTTANDERGFLISGSEEFLRQMDGRTAQMQEAFSRAYGSAHAGGQHEAIERLERSFEAWLASVEANIAAYRAGNREAAIQASLDETRLLRKEYEARLTGTRRLATSELTTAGDELTASITSTVTILAGYLVVAVVVGAAIAVWLVRRAPPFDSTQISELEPGERPPIRRAGEIG
jgi:methyl-accepting chemotaxis protein